MNIAYIKNYPKGVSLWTDKIRKIKYVMDERSQDISYFQKERMRYIAHSQTEIYKQINIKR